MTRLYSYYKTKVIQHLMMTLNYSSVMQVPRIDKIVLNMGVGSASSDKKILDNAISDLFKEVIQNRQELLAQNKGKIYFILNKVDQKTEKDREIPDVIEDLKRELAGFGFPDPIIYAASSRQGLLAKLIKHGKATESQTKDFKKFFSAKYATEDE